LFDSDERRQQDRGGSEQAECLGRAPAGVRGVDDRVDQQRQTGGDGDGTGGVEVARGRERARLGDVPRREGRDRDRHRHVDPQHPLPAEAIGEDAAEQHSCGAAGARDRTPGPERLVALGAVAEGVHDDRQRGGGDDRRAQALGGAGGDQLALVRGESGQQRGERDDSEAGEEDPPATQQVGHAAAEEQEAAEGQHVGVDDPGEVLLGEVQPLADRGQGDVHDRRVENDDELGEAEQREGDPATALKFLGGGHHLALPSPGGL
jgi:hypothetical protein